MIVTGYSTGATRASAAVLRAVLPLCLTACGAERPVVPAVSGASSASQYSPMAFTAAVDARARTVSIAPPSVASLTSPTPSLVGLERPNLSLLGSDVVRLVPSNIRISALGAFTPNRLRVTFDVTIENKLPSLALVAPTWPAPPAPFVMLFPLDYTATSAPGGVAGGDGNTVGVGLPGGGTVTPSSDWNGVGTSGSGAPYSFFGNSDCASNVTNNCFRWVSFGERLEPARDRPTRTVGFDIDPSVAQFRARMIVVADLAPAAVPPPQ